MKLQITIGIYAMCAVLGLATTGCSSSSLLYKKRFVEEQGRYRPQVNECETSYDSQDIGANGTDIMLGEFPKRKVTARANGEARHLAAWACFARALTLSPDNYDATLGAGIASLVAAKSTDYFDGSPRETSDHLDRAKELIGKAYMLRSGPLEPLYYLAEIAIMEGRGRLADQYLSQLESANYKVLDVKSLRNRLEKQRNGQNLTKQERRAALMVAMPISRRQYIADSKRFRIGFLSFGDNPGGRALSAILLTELQKTDRFEVFEGGGIRVFSGGYGAPITESTAKDFVDGYISGTMTKVSADEICFEVRLSTALTHHVLYTRSLCVPVEAGADEVPLLDRASLERLALDISRSIKEIQAGTVMGVDGVLVYIDAGIDHGVVPGMVGYVLGTGLTVEDQRITESVIEYTSARPPVNGDRVGDNKLIVGGVYIVSVEEKSSTGVLYRNGLTVEKENAQYAFPGDMVYFK